MSEQAIIKTGGKQSRINKGDKVRIDRIDGEEGAGSEGGGGNAGSLRSARGPGQRGRDARTEVVGKGCPAVAAHSEGLGRVRPLSGGATKPLSFRFDVGPVWLGRHRVVRVVRPKQPVGCIGPGECLTASSKAFFLRAPAGPFPRVAAARNS